MNNESEKRRMGGVPELNFELMLITVEITHPEEPHSGKGVRDKSRSVRLPPAAEKGSPAFFIMV